MASGRRGRGWRDEAAAALLVRHLPGIGTSGPGLVMGDPRPEVAQAFAAAGVDADRWDRRAFGGFRATPWPPAGPYGTVALRLPRSKEELDMALHAAAGALAPGGMFLLYGAKDEGIASAQERLGFLFRDVTTVAVGGHCRILRARARDVLPGLRKDLQAWREVFPVEHGGFRADWVSYPGVFARCRLDPGTRLLLDALPELPPEARVMDFACGSGVVGAVVRHRYPEVRLSLLDVDTVALEAARENVPEGRVLLADGLPPGDGEGYDAIVSNPPFHIGKDEAPEIVLSLIGQSPSLLKAGGVLALVAQRRLPLGEAFRGAFGSVTVRHEGGGFRVWEGRDPTWRPG